MIIIHVIMVFVMNVGNIILMNQNCPLCRGNVSKLKQNIYDKQYKTQYEIYVEMDAEMNTDSEYENNNSLITYNYYPFRAG